MKFVAQRIKDTADVSSGHESRSEQFKNFLFVAVALVLLYFVIGLVADAAAMRISEESEAKYFGATYFPTQTESAPPEFDRVREVLDRLSADKSLRPLPWKLMYSADTTANAFAVPGGAVIVTQGLLDSLTNESALAFVLGHELGHHQYRHTLKGVGRKLLLALTFGMALGSNDGGVVSGALGLAELKHSRHHERQADDFGFQLAYSHFGSADGYLDFFENLQQQSDLSDSPWLKFANSHPPTIERLKRLREMQAELQGRSLPKDRAAPQAAPPGQDETGTLP